MVKKKKKILVLTSTFPRWENDSIPPFVFELEKRLAKDFEIHILAPHFKGARKYEELEGLKIHRFQYFWPSNFQKVCYGGGMLPNIKKNPLLVLQLPLLIIAGIFSMRSIIKKEKIYLIHAHWVIPGGLTAILYKIFLNKNVAVFITAHSSYYKKVFSFYPLDVFYGWIVNKSAITVTVSKDMERKLSRVTGIKHKIISMGVDSSLFIPNSPNRNITKKYGVDLMLFVGRLVESKGIHFLIEVIKELAKIKPKTTLLVIGKGTDELSLQKKIKKYNLSKNVYLLGAVSHKKLVLFYQSAKIFIAPSKAESFGLVFAEAMMCECLVIGSDLESISDIIIDGKTGFQISTNNISQFTKKLLYIIDHYKQYDSLRKAGRLHVLRNYSWDIIIKKYGQIYKNL